MKAAMMMMVDRHSWLIPSVFADSGIITGGTCDRMVASVLYMLVLCKQKYFFSDYLNLLDLSIRLIPVYQHGVFCV